MRRGNRLRALRKGRLYYAPKAPVGEDYLYNVSQAAQQADRGDQLVLKGFFGDEEIAFLSDFLHENETITTLNLSFNALLTSKSAKVLASVLKSRNVLQHLILSSTSIDQTGAEFIAQALLENDELVTLRLAATRIGDEGVTALSNALKRANRLSTLDLSSCELGLKGVQSLAMALESNTGLLTLVVDDNGLGSKSAKIFAKALEVNKSLTALSMAENLIRDSGALELSKALEKNNFLLVLDITNNPVDADIEETIYRRLSQTRESHKKNMLEALNSGEKAPWYRGKLMVIGEGRAGKTATIRSLLKQKFEAGLASTVGVDTSETQAGGENSWRIHSTTGYTNTFIKMVIANPDRVKALKKSLTTQATKTIGISLSGEAKDAEMKEEKVDEGEDLDLDLDDSSHTIKPKKEVVGKQAFDHVYEAESSKLAEGITLRNAIKISIWDYGGQAVFQTLHHIFLTRYGLYLLVFSMEAFQDDPERSLVYIRFWLNSVKLHASEAPVLIVGTFLSSVKDPQSVEKIHRSIHSIVNPHFPQVILGNGAFLEIDNKRGIGIKALREQIEAVTRSQEYVHFPVSIQWTRLLDWMFGKKESWIKFTEVLETAQAMGIKTEEEVKEMLYIFHELGVLFYFTGTETLANIVTTRPQWLINKIALVIRDKQLHAHQGENIKKANLVDDATLLFKEGLLSSDLARLLWGKDHQTFLFDLMRQLLLLSEWNFEGKGEYYLVPSMITATPPRLELTGIKCRFDFQILPTGVYERLICVCVDYSSHQEVTMKPEMYLNIGRVMLQAGNIVTLHKSGNEIVVDTAKPEQASITLGILMLALKKLKDEVMGEGLEWNLCLEDPQTGAFTTHAKAKEATMEPWFVPVAEQPRATPTMDFSSFLETF